MIYKYKTLFIFYFLFSFSIQTYADCDSFKKGLELFDKNFYVLAQSLFDNYIECGSSEFLLEKSYYYSAVCSKEIYSQDAIFKFFDYIENYPEGVFVNDAYFNLGSIYFEKQKFKEAHSWYIKVKRESLDDFYSNLYFFRHGYTCFEDSLYKKSLFLFNNITKKSFYYNLGIYFSSHIYFLQSKYNLALEGFSKLSSIKGLSEISSYYKAVIYYKQKRYDELIDYGELKIREQSIKKQTHIKSLIAQSYYNLEMYEKCVKAFLKDSSFVYSDQAMYKFGYSLYKIDSIDYAIKVFESINSSVDSLSQYVSYYLGNCYLKKDNKRYAVNSFSHAKNYNNDIFIKEDAHYKYINLCFDLNWEFENLYDEILLYQEKFSDSENSETVKKLLIDYFTFTKDYNNAFSVLDKKASLDFLEKNAYQRISFFLAKDYYYNKDFVNAKKYFSYSLKHNIKSKYNSLANYFLAEIHFKIGDYQISVNYYKDFIFSSSSYKMQEYDVAKYSLAYSYFKLEQYRSSSNWFRKFLKNYQKKDKFYNDACLRLADSYFMLSDYDRANDFYSKVVKLDLFDADYALFQKIKCYELTSDFKYQKETLENFLSIYNLYKNESKYLDDVIYKYAIISLSENNLDKALDYFDRIILNFKESDFVRKAYLSKGLLYSNLYSLNSSKDDYFNKSKDNFIHLINKYQYTNEYNEALLGLKLLYTRSGKYKEYFEYLKSQDININTSAQDSIVFSSVESLYFKKEYSAAISGFSDYIDSYPNGSFYLSAFYYRAKSYLEKEEIIPALNDFIRVLDMNSKYHNQSLKFAAEISLQLKDYSTSLFYFTKLYKKVNDNHELKYVLSNIIKCQKELDLDLDLINSCNNFLLLDNLSDIDIYDTKFTLGNSYFKLSDFNKSKKIYKWLLGENYQNENITSQSRYNLAYMLFLDDSLSTSEEIIIKILDQSNDNYYIAKSLILLSDILVDQNNYFQAKATLSSIIKNYDGEFLVNEASIKLQDIIKMESILESKDSVSEEDIILDLLQDFKIDNNDLIGFE